MPDISELNGTAIANVAEFDGLTVTLAPAETFLLDTYTGAAAAYSVRRLASATTVLLRVRRDTGGGTGDDEEADVAYDSNNILSLDSAISNASAGVTATTLGQFINVGTVNGTTYTNPDSLAGTASCYVDTWYDQSGNSNNATQSTAGSQPQIHDGTVNTDLITENGTPCMSCVAPRHLTLNSGASQPFTQHIVCNPGTTGPLFAYGEPLMLRYDSGGTTKYHDGTFRTPSPSFTSAAGDQNHNMLFYYGATTGYAVQNQSSHQEDASVGFGALKVATQSLGGKTTSGNIAALQEFVIWDNDQYSNRSGIETDTNNYFSIF